ncbi:hypothetical protein [Bradyrhizobium elkanii]|uniref:hypothetical protein n=1 Tax=Bradyrhizobium elkanii TaxID=29448 RepID=UPI000489D0E3|nr:hypothetical protein [Bradyrhizobium elkanii]
MAHPGLALQIGDHPFNFVGIDGGGDELCHDLQKVVAGFDDIHVGGWPGYPTRFTLILTPAVPK